MKVLRWLDKHFEEALLSVFLLTLIVLTSANVILRYIFNSGLTWSDEISKYCLIFSGFTSISYWIRNKSGICVDALVQILPEKVQKILRILTQVIVFLFFAWMFKGSIRVLQSVAKSGQVSGTLQISMVYIYMAPVLGFGLALIRVIQMLAIDAQKKEKGGDA